MQIVTVADLSLRAFFNNIQYDNIQYVIYNNYYDMEEAYAATHYAVPDKTLQLPAALVCAWSPLSSLALNLLSLNACSDHDPCNGYKV